MRPGEDQNVFVLIQSAADYVAVEVLARPSDPDYWDGNWCTCAVSASLGHFRTRFEAYLRTDEFERYCQELEKLSVVLAGQAKFEALEDQVRIKLLAKATGQIEIEGVLTDVCGIGNRLNFRFETDQTFLPPIIDELKRFLGRYPVRDSDKKIATLRSRGS